VAIFVNGCFWHHHSRCKRSKLPTTSREFWAKKIMGNALRDQRNKKALRRLGWKSITVWQCQLAPSRADARLLALLRALSKASPRHRLSE
jgi:DNA mismatch endonuclease (patch repair protein)